LRKGPVIKRRTSGEKKETSSEAWERGPNLGLGSSRNETARHAVGSKKKKFPRKNENGAMQRAGRGAIMIMGDGRQDTAGAKKQEEEPKMVQSQ